MRTLLLISAIRPIFLYVGLVCFLGVCASGCAVVMAMKGSPEPNFSVLEVGATRGQIELQLGSAKSTKPGTDGAKIDLYVVETGNAPSPERAVLHGVVDLLTLFLWEPVGTVIELLQGKQKYIEIEYDENDYAARIRTMSEPPPELMQAQN